MSRVGRGRGGMPSFNEGDWTCPGCNNLNFARRLECNRCGEKKQPGVKKIKKGGVQIGKAAAEKSHGLFSADDWICKTCGNVNWARRGDCNMCNSPKVGIQEERTGLGGGFNERQNVEYKHREESDDEYDQYGRLKRRKSQNGTKVRPKEDVRKDPSPPPESDEEEDSEEEDVDLSKYDLDDDDEDEEGASKYDLESSDDDGAQSTSSRSRSRSRSSSRSRSRSLSRKRRYSSSSSDDNRRSSSNKRNRRLLESEFHADVTGSNGLCAKGPEVEVALPATISDDVIDHVTTPVKNKQYEKKNFVDHRQKHVKQRV